MPRAGEGNIEGRCDDGINASPWTELEAQKGLSCVSDQVLLDLSCVVLNGTDASAGWSNGRGRGECTVKALYGLDTYLYCDVPDCVYATGSLQASCGDIHCGQDLTQPGAVSNPLAEAFVAQLSGALEVNCEPASVNDQTIACNVELGAFVFDAECEVSRCILSTAPPAAEYDLNPRDVTAECQAQLDDRFPALAVGCAGVAIGLIILIVGACSGGMNEQPASEKVKAASAKVIRRMSSRGPNRNPKAPTAVADSDMDVLCEMVQKIAPLKRPPQLSWESLSVTARGSNPCTMGPTIVKPNTGALCKGCTALMGPSGSGKTTLLHAVTGMPHAGMKRGGSATLNGMEVTKLPHGVISLVPQDAVLPEELSAREALVFASALGLRHVSKADRLALVDAILTRLYIRSVSHLQIGGRDAGRSGLSGGERKRVSVGVSVAMCPQALLLDEPSSGLDAYSAYELVRLLQTLCTRTNRTVLVSVHQPSSQLFELFDGLLLLTKGKKMYHGPPLGAVSALSALGAPSAEPGVAPADHLLHVLVTHEELMLNAEMPPDPASAHPAAFASGSASGTAPAGSALASLVLAPCASFTEAKWLGWRCIAQMAREPSLVRTQLVIHLLVALFMGGIFFEVDSDIAGFQNKAGSISFITAFFALGGLSTSQTVTREWPLLWAEYHMGLYGAITYTITRLVLELLLLRVLPSVAFSGIFYAMMGLKREILPFFRFLLAAALASADSAALCALISACAPRQPGATSLVATVALLVCLLLNGFNINLTALPDWAKWISWVSFGRHSFEVMLAGELEGQLVNVEVPNSPSIQIRADVLLGTMGLDPTRYNAAFVDLCLIGLVLIVVTAVIVTLQMQPSCKRAAMAELSAVRRQSTLLLKKADLPEATDMPESKSTTRLSTPVASRHGSLGRENSVIISAAQIEVMDASSSPAPQIAAIEVRESGAPPAPSGRESGLSGASKRLSSTDYNAEMLKEDSAAVDQLKRATSIGL